MRSSRHRRRAPSRGLWGWARPPRSPRSGVCAIAGVSARAVAAASSLFGFASGAALATVVGGLVEVPAMLLVVRAVRRSRGWYEHGAQR